MLLTKLVMKMQVNKVTAKCLQLVVFSLYEEHNFYTIEMLLLMMILQLHDEENGFICSFQISSDGVN